MSKIKIGAKYMLDPPIGPKNNKGKISIVKSKADVEMKWFIEEMWPHYAIGLDWYDTDYGWAREDWLKEIEGEE